MIAWSEYGSFSIIFAEDDYLQLRRGTVFTFIYLLLKVISEL